MSPQQGLVRFAKRSHLSARHGSDQQHGFTPAPYSNESGVVRVPFGSAWDRDDTTITYDVFRGPATKIATDHAQRQRVLEAAER